MWPHPLLGGRRVAWISETILVPGSGCNGNNRLRICSTWSKALVQGAGPIPWPGRILGLPPGVPWRLSRVGRAAHTAVGVAGADNALEDERELPVGAGPQRHHRPLCRGLQRSSGTQRSLRSPPLGAHIQASRRPPGAHSTCSMRTCRGHLSHLIRRRRRVDGAQLLQRRPRGVQEMPSLVLPVPSRGAPCWHGKGRPGPQGPGGGGGGRRAGSAAWPRDAAAALPAQRLAGSPRAPEGSQVQRRRAAAAGRPGLRCCMSGRPRGRRRWRCRPGGAGVRPPRAGRRRARTDGAQGRGRAARQGRAAAGTHGAGGLHPGMCRSSGAIQDHCSVPAAKAGRANHALTLS
jgi:hypothetical protein